MTNTATRKRSLRSVIARQRRERREARGSTTPRRRRVPSLAERMEPIRGTLTGPQRMAAAHRLTRKTVEEFGGKYQETFNYNMRWLANRNLN